MQIPGAWGDCCEKRWQEEGGLAQITTEKEQISDRWFYSFAFVIFANSEPLLSLALGKLDKRAFLDALNTQAGVLSGDL